MNDVFVIGGGPSLRGFNFTRLKGRQVIACNLAFEFVPWALAVCFWDPQFFQTYQKELLRFDGWKVTHKGVTGDAVNNPKNKIVELDANTYGNVNNTGHFALGLATEMECDHIYLLGYDMTAPADEKEWAQIMGSGGMNFYRYPARFMVNSFAEYIEKFDMFKEFPVFNCNPNSGLRQFPFADINEVL